MLDFDRVDSALGEAAVGAAEAHGVLLGMMCVNGADVEPAAWWAQIRQDDEQVVFPAELVHVLGETRAGLTELVGSFDLMLPDDEATIGERAEALHAWCQGFMYGWGVAGGGRFDELPGDSEEILRDIHQLAQSSFDLGDDLEEDERAYSELVEYLRVGVMLLYETLHPRPEPTPADGRERDVAAFWSQAQGPHTLH